MGYKPWIPARDIIDWSIPGQSIFDRKKPLADATIRRIAAGIEKYWGDYAEPFLATLYGTGGARSLDAPLSSVSCVAHHALIQPILLGQQSCAAARPVEEPCPTVATAGAISLIQPFITRYQGDHDGKQDGDSRNHKIERPLPCVDTSNRYALVEPLIIEYYGNGGTEPVSSPLKTVTTKDRFALLEPFILPNEGYYRGNKARSLDTPLNAVTSRGAGGIVTPLIMGHQSGQSPRPVDQPVHSVLAQGRINLIEAVGFDIRFRMLKNHELKKAQGFDGEYIIKGNVTEQTKQIGNAVPPPLAKALTKAALSA